MELYIIENYKEIYPEQRGSDLTDALIKQCLTDYGLKNPKIIRTNEGKPYTDSKIDGRNIYFSVSHSAGYFVCVIDDVEIGIDVQAIRNVSAEKISNRYFTDKERDYMSHNGREGFFSLWTRKEAYSKLIGTGLREVIKGSEVVDRDDLLFIDMQLEKNVFCSICMWK